MLLFGVQVWIVVDVNDLISSGFWWRIERIPKSVECDTEPTTCQCKIIPFLLYEKQVSLLSVGVRQSDGQSKMSGRSESTCPVMFRQLHQCREAAFSAVAFQQFIQRQYVGSSHYSFLTVNVFVQCANYSFVHCFTVNYTNHQTFLNSDSWHL